MNVKLAYGKTGLELSLPDNVDIDVIEPKYVEGITNPAQTIRNSLRNPEASKPLKELVNPTDRIAIVFSDITRPTPNHIILPAILDELNFIPDKQITLFNATGTHRPNTIDELRNMLGPEIADRYRIVQNMATDPDSHKMIGTTKSGNEVCIHKEYLKCSVKILTGFIEPHFFAGFSGGPKACMPGIAGIETIFRNHSAKNMDSRWATWAITYGNPAWEEFLEAVKMAGPAFLVNVALNSDKQITAVFAGDIEKAHTKGCEFVKKNAMAPVQKPYDIVIASNSGYPLDLNLYQSVKAMSAAAQIIKKAGSIIVAADCWDGIPDHGGFAELLSAAASIEELLETVRSPQLRKQDMWQAHLQALICQKADVYFYSHNLTDEQIKNALLIPCHDIEQTVKILLDKYGPEARLCVLPQGPMTIPYLIDEN
ncbi:MAG: nickel-dependent lactate racemase [Planctomycetota bacterium]|jgi:nickel-dependent lactate racemase